MHKKLWISILTLLLPGNGSSLTLSDIKELAPIIRMQETRDGRNTGCCPARDWTNYHIHWKTGIYYISKLPKNSLSELYILIMTDKVRKCTRFGREAWSCYHSATDYYRRRYVWACMRWMSVEQIRKYINLEEYSYDD